MEVFYMVTALLGGLALFLYGMRIMGDGLKSSSGGAMKTALAKVTNKPFMGFVLGLIVTCMIQSSTATIVLTVGLVGAGFLTFRQSVGIVLGANVGTAITAQILRLMDLKAADSSPINLLKSEHLAPIALMIGIVLIMFVGRSKKNRNAHTAGTICMGFGILFVGLMNMSNTVQALFDPEASKEVQDMGKALANLLVSFENSPPLGFFSGVIVTGIIQSSSAVVGILQAIAKDGGVTSAGVASAHITFGGVFAVIVGVNIGDCLTTYLVSRIGAKPEQIRVCLVHIIYNICAAALIFVSVFILRNAGALDWIWNKTFDSGDVANLHGLFRLAPAILFLPLSGVFANLAEKIVKDKPVDSEDADIEKNLRELDEHLLTNPGLALGESRHLIGHMADVSLHNYDAAISQLKGFDDKRSTRIRQREDLLDRMADSSYKYVLAVSPYIKLKNDDLEQNYQLKALGCFERIGDLAVDIVKNVEETKEKNIVFSEKAVIELDIAFRAVRDILVASINAYKSEDTSDAAHIEPMEEAIDELIDELRTRHVNRATKGECDPLGGIIFQNILLHLERISDQCSDLAVYLLGKNNDEISGKEHQYIHNLHHSSTEEYLADFKAARTRFFESLPIDDQDTSLLTGKK